MGEVCDLSRRDDVFVLHWHDGAAQHLDALLACEEIDAVQLGHDPSSLPFRRQLPHMRAIQEAGKGLFISCVDACDVEFFIRNLDPRRLAMIIDTKNDDESKAMDERSRRWAEERRAQLGGT